MATHRSPIGELTTLATADDVNGTVDGTQNFDITGAAGVLIIQRNDGTAGTAGVDVIEFSRDGGTNWLAATAANLGGGHDGLLLEDGTAAAAASAALNSAGAEPTACAVFSLAPVDGPCLIRVARGGSGAGGTAWVTGAPSVVALRIG